MQRKRRRDEALRQSLENVEQNTHANQEMLDIKYDFTERPLPVD